MQDALNVATQSNFYHGLVHETGTEWYRRALCRNADPHRH
jgi:hypothetical protein